MAFKQFGAMIVLLCGLAPACSGEGGSDPTATESQTLAAACVDNVLCIAGDHWDSVACKCVPNVPTQCVSGPGGPCGGFTQNPCVCGRGTHCVPNRIPDIPGVCAVCDPIRCPAGEHWDRSSCSCVAGCLTASDCHGALPALCRVCADGTDGCAHFECVAGACEIAYCN